jgi:hypothetical protein
MGEPLRTAPRSVWRPSQRFRRAIVPAFPVLAALVVLLAPDEVATATALVLGVGAVALVVRHPVPGLLAVPALLPFQQVLLALLFRLGAPAGVVRGLGFWKEGVAAGLVIAAIERGRANDTRLDGLDVLAALLVLNNLLYRLAPRVFSPNEVTPDAATLNLALRGSTAFVVLFVAGRRLADLEDVRARFAKVVLVAGGVVAAIGLVEHLLSDWWNSFAVSVLDIPGYRTRILDVTVANPADIRVYTEVAGRNVVRIGSVFFDQLACGLFLVLVLAVALEHLARSDGARWANALAPLVGVGIVLTQTRAAVLAGLVCIVLALRPAPGRDPRARERVALAVAAGLVALVPLAVSTGLATRTIESIGARDESTQIHQARSATALKNLVSTPFGSGLGTTSEVARRAGVENPRYTENYYLEVGGETGVHALLLFASISVLTVLHLHRRTHRSDGDLPPAAWRGALVGLALAALLLPVWIDLSVSWPFWLGAGLMVGPPSPIPVPVHGTLTRPRP